MSRNPLLLPLILLAAACAPKPQVAPTVEVLPSPRPTTATAFAPVPPTSTPSPTPTPYVYPTAIFTDAVEPPSPQQFYLERGMVGELEGWAFVLLGSDALPHRSEMDRTDAFVIVLVNLAKGHVSLVSVPRDMHIYLPGYGMTRINGAWTLRGEQGLKDALRYNFGLNMDGYVFARPGTLRQFIDEALGGVTVNVPEAVLDRCGDLVIDMLPGPRDMSGDVALCYARVRMTSSDYPRMLRQQSLLIAMREKALTLAGQDPFGFFARSLSVARDMGLQTSATFFDVVEWLWPVITQDIGLLSRVPLQYRMMPPFSVHFDHPVTGAWLLAPPRDACMAWLVDQAWNGEPWLEGEGNIVAGPCQAGY